MHPSTLLFIKDTDYNNKTIVIVGEIRFPNIQNDLSLKLWTNESTFESAGCVNLLNMYYCTEHKSTLDATSRTSKSIDFAHMVRHRETTNFGPTFL